MAEACKRASCINERAPRQAYCSKECSPYGLFGLAEQLQGKTLPQGVMKKEPKREPRRYVKSQKKLLNPGNGRIATKFTDTFITMLFDPKYLDSWSEDSLSKVSNRMKFISVELDKALSSRYKSK